MKKQKCPRCGSGHYSVDKREGVWMAKCRDCKKEFLYFQTHFQGEMMTCALCDKQEQSDPEAESQWRLLERDDREFYICPDHLPPDGSGVLAFKRAYDRIYAELMRRS